MPIVQPPPLITEKTFVTPGLADQDDNIDLLLRYFTEMQKTTVETSQPDDLLSFVACAPFFGVIMLETTSTPVAEVYMSDDEDEQEVAIGMPLAERDDSIYLATSRATVSRPPSTIHNFTDSVPQLSPDSERLQVLRAAASTTPTETLFPTLSPDDKVLLWREAFMEKLEETADEPLVPLDGGSPGVRPIYASAGGVAEIGPDADAEAPMAADTADEPGSHFINWPDEGPAHEAPADAHSVEAQEVDYMVLDGSSPILSPHAEDGVGREHLSPETGPMEELAELPQDPHMQALVYDSAVRLQQTLREQRVKKYLAAQRRRSRARTVRNPKPVDPPTTTRKPIGLIYLWNSQTFLDPLHMGECGLGVYVDPEHRGKDCLFEAVDGVVKLAFQDPDCHRLQSIIVEHPDKLYILELLARAGFRNEGIRRRAFFSTKECEWKDVTYFAMLATEWVYDANNSNSGVRLRTASLWDEVFARHQKECDDLIRLEEKSTLKRSCSLETIRERVVSSLSVASSLRSDDDDNATDTGSSVRSSILTSPKRRRLGHNNGQWRPTASSSAASTSSGPGSEWDAASVVSSSAFGGPPLSSASSASGSTSSSSQWNVI